MSIRSITARLLRSWLAMLAAATLLVLTPGAAHATELNEHQEGCSQRSDIVPADVTARPVVFVHGWMSSSADSKAATRALQAELGDGFAVFAFDYQFLNSAWPVGVLTEHCLADYIDSLHAAHQSADGTGGVLGVGHSMGGIALRAAAGQLVDGGREDRLAGVVTLGTPHRGSPMGGGTAATVLQELKRILVDFTSHQGLVNGGTTAAACLAAPRPGNCGIPPYLPDASQVATVGTQITIKRQLFDIDISENSADIQVFGDGIVPADSAHGYVDSGLGTMTGETIGTITEDCSVSSSYLSWSRLFRNSLKRGPLGGATVEAVRSWLSMWTDHTAMDGFESNTFNIAQVPLLALAMESDCFHSSLTTYAPVVHGAANLLVAMNGRFGAREVDASRGQRRWLHELDNDGDGFSGSYTTGRMGQRGQLSFPRSTGQAIGCTPLPQATAYRLDGGYTSMRATAGLHVPTIHAGNVRWQFVANGNVLEEFTLMPHEVRSVELDLTGLEEFSVHTAAIDWDRCPPDGQAKGILGDATVEEVPAPAETEDQDPAARHGWPTTRDDAPAGFKMWFGAAATRGYTNVTVLRWSTCAGQVCIGGDGERVAVLKRTGTGWQPLGEFIPDSPAHDVLVELKLPDAVVAALLAK